MRTLKFQLAVAVMVGLFAGQAAQAVELLAIQDNLNDQNELVSQSAVLLNTETGQITDFGVITDFFFPEADLLDDFGPILAIDRIPNPDGFPPGSDGSFYALTESSDGLQIDIFGKNNGDPEFRSVTAIQLAGLERMDGSSLFDGPPGSNTAGIAFDIDGDGNGTDGDLLITTGPDLLRFGGSDVLLGDSSATAINDVLTTRDTDGNPETPVVPDDRNLTSLASSPGNTLFAVGTSTEDSNNDQNFESGLFEVGDEPDVDFGELDPVDGELLPAFDDSASAFGSIFTAGNGRLFMTDPLDPNLGMRDPATGALLVGPVDLTQRFIDANNNDPNILAGIRALTRLPVQDAGVPEPVTGVLGLLGLAVLGAATRRRVA